LLVFIIFVLAIPQIVASGSASNDEGGKGPFERKASWFILAFAGIQRYAIPLEQLAPLVIFILLSWLCGTRRSFIQSATMSVAILLVTTVAPNWGRASFGKSWFDVHIPNELTSDHALYVMLSGEPIAYVIPFFPASDAFIRIDGNMPLVPMVALGREALSKIRSHKGMIRTLSPAGYSLQQSTERLKSFELELSEEGCVEIESKPGKLQSCPLVWRGE
jgi:hypothetical protein